MFEMPEAWTAHAAPSPDRRIEPETPTATHAPFPKATPFSDLSEPVKLVGCTSQFVPSVEDRTNPGSCASEMKRPLA